MAKKEVSTLMNAQKYVAKWFSISGINALKAKNDPNTYKKMFVEYHEQARAAKAMGTLKGPVLLKDELQYAYELFIQEAFIQEREKQLDTFHCQGENLEPLRQWLSAMATSPEGLDVNVMAHWLWQVKRRAYGKSVIHHIMPILYGPQGSGKSMGINALIGPLKAHLLSVKIDHLESEKNMPAFSDNLIIFFDEMMKIARTDVEVLKHQISTDINTYRPLYTNTNVTVKQNCSFIGATNKPLNELMNDTTGNRRFHEIKTPVRCNWELVKQIDYISLWKGIDENKEYGYLLERERDELAILQAAFTRVEDVELFIRKMRLRLISESDGETINAINIYDQYVVWCRRQGMKEYDYPYFCKRLFNSGIDRVTNKSASGTDDYVLISNNNLLNILNPNSPKLVKEKV